MYPKAIDDLIASFEQLPGIGHKTAERLVLQMLNNSEAYLSSFSNNIARIKSEVKVCPNCFFYAEDGLCHICRSKRDQSIICVVELAKDVVALEKMQTFNGTYHVLGGRLSPMDGIGVDDLRIKELIKRVVENIEVKELVIATNPTVDGDATAKYIAKLLEKTGVIVTRIAHGLPVGSDLEYADELTLFRAMQGRIKL